MVPDGQLYQFRICATKISLLFQVSSKHQDNRKINPSAQFSCGDKILCNYYSNEFNHSWFQVASWEDYHPRVEGNSFGPPSTLAALLLDAY